jgi:CxxC motif-containing protein (DUF1111 family)
MKSCRAFTAPGGERFTRLRAPVLPLHLQGVANTDHANLVKGVHMLRSFPRPTAFGALIALLLAASAPAATWVEFANQTATRLVADPSVGTADAEEKDYAWGDVDKDGDIDIVCVRKQPFTTPGRRANVLFMNEGTAEGHAIDGVFVDRTAQYATDADDGGQGFLDLTNDRDVILADVDGDTWLDIITVATISDGLPKTISHPRIYRNKGEIAGVWQGFRYEQARIPQLRTIPGNVAVAPRFCSVVAGDVTGDGAVDLYFGDYDSGGVGGATPEDPADDVNDRLLINTGTGFFVDSLENRMTGEMLLSAFSMAAAIADMNGDGVLDVVKDSALNAPQRVSVSYNDPANEGFFDELDVVYNDAPYHISVGDLNNDNRLDIVITDDGQDAYLLNQGNGADGLADFLTYPFLRSSGGDAEFGGNSVIADLNQDSFNDVLIADVDVDSPGCSRRLHLYRNLGDTPEVTLQEQGGAEPWTPNGVHDVAVFDINNDGYPDMFVGTCTTTQVWINVPPPDLVFTYPDGLPGTLAPGVSATFRVSVSGTGSTPQPGTGQQYVSVDGGPFTQTAMVEESPNVYFVNLPAVACTSTVRFYVSVETDTAITVNDPTDAPTDTFSALASLGTQVVFEDAFETAVPGWTVTNGPGLGSGAWERVDPIGTFFPTGSSTFAQPEDDFGAAGEETQCYITAQHPGGSNAGAADVDGGPTTLTSPVFDLAGTDAQISFARWQFSNTGGTSTPDPLVTEITNDGTNWVQVDSILSTGGEWLPLTFNVSTYVEPTSLVQVRFIASDSPNNSVTESGIDSFVVTRLVCDTSCVDNSDCDDTLFCNGAEICDVDTCSSGLPPCSGQLCDEVNDLCVDCLGDGDCDDGLFCNGAETCSNGVCVAGGDPCGPGLTCDEANDLCVGCLDDNDCDDGVFCNGAETCAAGTCFPAGGGVANGGFADGTNWASNIPVDGSIAFGGSLTVVGSDNDTGGFTWAAQSAVNLNGANLEFDLLSYSSGDTGAFDRPVMRIDGDFYGLDADGTVGTITTGGDDASGTIDNGNQVGSPIHFTIDVEALVGAGPHDIGLGVMSVDGQFGAGTAVFDDVLPPLSPADPCPGQLCDEANDVCVDCLGDGDCDDGQFCNGAEVCSNGTCSAGNDPCPGQLCDEVTDTCFDCIGDGDCDDGVFCNGAETCDAGTCVAGMPPCGDLTCDESADACDRLIQPRVGQPVLGLTPTQVDRFQVGRFRFDEVLTATNGLGPVFNQNSCSSCHSVGDIGGSGSIKVTRFGLESKGQFDGLENFGGTLLQANAIDLGCEEVVPAEANVVINRITISTFGSGLVEAIAAADLLENAINPPAGISGVAHWVPAAEDPPGAPLRVGRFGWKSQVATVLTFSGDASVNEMGLTNRLFPNENDPNGIRPPDLAACDTVPDPEDGPDGQGFDFIDRVTDFQRFLAAPPQTPRSGMTGEAVFNSIGCADCHTRSFTTGPASEAALSHRTIKPYSDFLLHDMGQLGDGIVQGDATATEFRTPSLWGLRFRNQLLHDGRVQGGTFAARMAAAIAAHGATGSEGAASAGAFEALTPAEQDALVAFLDSLGRAEFDHDGDNDVDISDVTAMEACMNGPASAPHSPDDACAISDFDQDGDVDLRDAAALQRAYSGSQ